MTSPSADAKHFYRAVNVFGPCTQWAFRPSFYATLFVVIVFDGQDCSILNSYILPSLINRSPNPRDLCTTDENIVDGDVNKLDNVADKTHDED